MEKSSLKGIEVTPKPNEQPERMIKRFMKKVRNEGILQEIFLRRCYEKPSVKKKRKKSKARFMRRIEEKPADKN